MEHWLVLAAIFTTAAGCFAVGLLAGFAFCFWLFFGEGRTETGRVEVRIKP